MYFELDQENPKFGIGRCIFWEKTWTSRKGLSDLNAALHFSQEQYKNLKPNGRVGNWEKTLDAQALALRTKLDPTSFFNQQVREMEETMDQRTKGHPNHD